MSPLDGRRVIVVGAGLGGTAAAILCAHAGARVTLLDRSPHHAVDVGMVLQPDGLAVLHALGLGERLSRRGRRVTRRRIANARNRTLLAGAVRRSADDLDHALAIRRSELEAAMADVIAAEPRLTRRVGAEVRDVRVDGTLIYSVPGGVSSSRADLIIAADGMRSPIRTRIGMPARTDGRWWYARGIGPSLPQLTTITEYWTPLGVFGMSPLAHGTSFYVATRDPSATRPLRDRDLERFCAAWLEALPVAAPMIAGVTTFDGLEIGRTTPVDCPWWSDGRIVLLGDAAHATAPNLTNGASSALADAYVLTSELVRCPDQAEALRRYERRRRAAHLAARRRIGRMVRVSTTEHPAARLLREGIIQLAGRWLIGNVSLRELHRDDHAATGASLTGALVGSAS